MWQCASAYLHVATGLPFKNVSDLALARACPCLAPPPPSTTSLSPTAQIRVTLVWDIILNPDPVLGWPQCRTLGALPTHVNDSNGGYDTCIAANVITEGRCDGSPVCCAFVVLLHQGGSHPEHIA